MWSFLRVIPELSLAGLVVGCGADRAFVTEERLDHGLVIVLSGIEGRSLYNREICRGLNQGAGEFAIERKPWTLLGRLSFLYNLRAEQRNRRKAAEIASYIMEYQDSHPGRPVFLVGQSGGTAIAAWIAEALPPDRQIEGIVMLASALSPGYPLETALSRCRRGIVSFYSRWDIVFCGAGTTVFGTADGRHGPSAACVGFDVPKSAGGDRPYRKLFQVRWQRWMARYWYLGGHVTSGARPFVATCISPLLRAETWDEAAIRSITGHR